MSAVESTGPVAASGLRRLEGAVVALLCLLLPAGFRERQRGEWTGDLLVLAEGNPAARGRYLLGAARTIPSLRSAISRRDDALLEVPPGVRATLARVFLLGLAWPILSWLLWVPARYYALDIPGRLARIDYALDPQSVWPFDSSPLWLAPLWAVPHLGAWAAVLGGPYLLAAVGAVGTATAALRRRRRRVHPLTVALAALFAVLGVVLLAAFPSGSLGVDDGSTAGLLGAAAVLLGITTRNLRNGSRAALLLLGLGAIAVFLTFQTAPGTAMIVWFMD